MMTKLLGPWTLYSSVTRNYLTRFPASSYLQKQWPQSRGFQRLVFLVAAFLALVLSHCLLDQDIELLEELLQLVFCSESQLASITSLVGGPWWSHPPHTWPHHNNTSLSGLGLGGVKRALTNSSSTPSSAVKEPTMRKVTGVSELDITITGHVDIIFMQIALVVMTT